MNKFLKVSIWLIGGIASLLFALYLIMLAINWSDESPSPAYLEMTNRLATRQIAPDADNGFIYMMGICAPQGTAPSLFGAERIRKANELIAKPGKVLPDDLWQEDCSAISIHNDIIVQIRKSCSIANAACFDALLKNEQAVEDWLLTQGWLLERYQQLLSYQKWSTTLIFDVRMPFIRVSTIRYLQDILFLHAWIQSGQGNSTEVNRLLEADINFWRTVLASAETLLDKSIAINSIRRHFTFGNLILRRFNGNMVFTAIPASWKSPLSDTELSMYKVNTGEFAFSSRIILNNDAFTEQNNDWLSGPFLEQFFQPQATLNETAAMLLQTEKLLDVPYSRFQDAQMKAEELEDGLGMYHWYNMSGRTLLPLFVSNQTSLTTLTYNLEGKRRAALLTSMLRSEGIEADSITESLARSDIRNPYTNEPFSWDADSGSIIYRGLYESSTANVAYLY